MYHVSENLLRQSDIKLIISHIGSANIEKYKKIAKEKNMSKEQEISMYRRMIKELKNNDYALGVVISRVAYNLFYEKLYEEIQQ